MCVYFYVKIKRKLHDLLTDKMLFAVKQTDDFYARTAKRTLYADWSTTISKAKDIK